MHLSLHGAMDPNLNLLLAVLGLHTDSVLSPSWTAWGSITWESALRAYRRSSQVHLSLHPCAALIAILVWLASVVVLTIGGGHDGAKIAQDGATMRPRCGPDEAKMRPRWGHHEAKIAQDEIKMKLPEGLDMPKMTCGEPNRVR